MVDSLDTNLLVRYYTNDEPGQRALVVGLLANGGPLFVSVTVVIELVWVLQKVARVPRAGVLSVLRHLLALAPVYLEDEPAVAAATDGFGRGLDFADALHLARSAACERMLTFDRKFALRANRLKLAPRCVVPSTTRPLGNPA